MDFVYSTRNRDIPTAYSHLDAMHTRCELLLPGMDESPARELARWVWDLVLDAEGRYNRFDPESSLSRLNGTAGKEATPVDDEMFMVLELCRTLRLATGGYFDISAHCRMEGRDWVLDPGGRTVRFTREGMSLDLGGFIKGYVLAKAAERISQHTHCALLTFGGSSTASVGEHPLGGPWQVSVAHPFFGDKVLATFPLSGNSLSVSGKDPHGRGHIMDPRSGNTLDRDELIAVLGRSALLGEVLSTALWAAPHNERKGILSVFDGYRAWELIPLTDGKAISTEI